MKRTPKKESAAKFSHLNAKGKARMVDVSAKPDQKRRAVAEGWLFCRKETVLALRDQKIAKGDVLTVAQIAGIQAAKRTSDWIPLCHPLSLQHVGLNFELSEQGIYITAETRTVGKTGVEMEALTAVSAAALTLYDMCKAVDKEMVIGPIRLLKKEKK